MSFDKDLVPILAALKEYFNSSSNSSSGTQLTCLNIIPFDNLLYQFLLIPAVIFTVVLTFADKRVNVCLQCLAGRPGVVYPMDIMGRSNRFSYAAAFGATATLCYNVIFRQRFAVKLTGPKYVTVFGTLLSMLVYGIDYMPLFTALTANSSLGYFIATIYAWGFTAIFGVSNLYCLSFDLTFVIYWVIRNLPEIFCHLYLSFSCPARFIRSLWRKRQFQELAVDYEDESDILESIRSSYQGLHVRKLLTKPKPPKEPNNGCIDKLVSLVTVLYDTVGYKRLENFRYSTRMLSVSVVAIILLYEAYVELMTLVLMLFKKLFAFFDFAFVILPTEHHLSLQIIQYGVKSMYVSLIVSMTIGFVVGVIMILHTLTSYRTLLLGLYKGDNAHLTTKEERSNSTLLVGSLRYAGYQVAYIAWGYLIQFLILFIFSMILSVLILLIKNGIHAWALTVLQSVWPVLVISLVVNIVQKLMAMFAFLQKRGSVLALNNRRVFFVVAYFMFFYNIFLGLVSCLLRIVKAVVLGALFLPRLDHSTLPRKFQRFDAGFDAFCGFMHVENAHTHPVVLTFISLVQAEILEKKRLKEQSIETIENGSMLNKPVNTVARFKWKLAYTLLKNPQIFIQRKDAMMQIFRQGQRDDSTTKIVDHSSIELQEKHSEKRKSFDEISWY